MTLAYSPYHRQPCFLSPITPQPYSVALILPSFPPPLAYTNQCADPTVLLPLLHPFAHAATTGTIFCFTRLSAAKSACHDYMNVFPASHCRTYYNTKLLQQSASSWLLTVFGPDAATTTTIAPATHRWCWLLSSRHRPLSKE